MTAQSMFSGSSQGARRRLAAALSIGLVAASCSGAASPTAAPSLVAPSPSPTVAAATAAPTSPSIAPTAVPTAIATASAGAAAAVLWTGPKLTTTPMAAADSAKVDATVAGALTAYPDIPGMWVGVWDPDKGSYAQAYGESVKGGAKAAIAEHGRIGSVTKTFTVTAVLEQVAQGKLRLDSTIADVLPDLAAMYPTIAKITVKQLAGMTSGIQDYANTGVVLKGVVADPTKVWTADELIAAAMTLPVAAPGTGGYSTTNTQILAKMLEKLTGKSAEQVVTEVAQQAGLTDTMLQAPDVVAMPDPSSHGYIGSKAAADLTKLGAPVKPGTDVTDWTASWGQAGGGMYSTVADLGKWAATGLGTSLLPADLAAQRFATTKIPEGNYGLGLQDWGKGWVGHTGQLIGWESWVAYNKETGAAFVAIINDTSSIEGPVVVGMTLFPTLIGMLGG